MRSALPAKSLISVETIFVFPFHEAILQISAIALNLEFASTVHNRSVAGVAQSEEQQRLGRYQLLAVSW